MGCVIGFVTIDGKRVPIGHIIWSHGELAWSLTSMVNLIYNGNIQFNDLRRYDTLQDAKHTLEYEFLYRFVK